VHADIRRVAEQPGVAGDRFEHRLLVVARAGDDLKDLAGRGLAGGGRGRDVCGAGPRLGPLKWCGLRIFWLKLLGLISLIDF
jgi:hypothetical protein